MTDILIAIKWWLIDLPVTLIIAIKDNYGIPAAIIAVGLVVILALRKKAR